MRHKLTLLLAIIVLVATFFALVGPVLAQGPTGHPDPNRTDRGLGDDLHAKKDVNHDDKGTPVPTAKPDPTKARVEPTAVPVIPTVVKATTVPTGVPANPTGVPTNVAKPTKPSGDETGAPPSAPGCPVCCTPKLGTQYVLDYTKVEGGVEVTGTITYTLRAVIEP